MDPAIPEILSLYGLASNLTVEPIGSGHIHWTYRVLGNETYVLQRMNVHVFKRPDWIESNLRVAQNYLEQRYPDYAFAAPLPTISGDKTTLDSDGRPWRLFPHLANVLTIDCVETTEQAYYAAAEFARLASRLQGAPVDQFYETIPRFHDLAWRLEEFDNALSLASADRQHQAEAEIRACQAFRRLAARLTNLLDVGVLRRGVFHNDAKINNVLFDANRRTTVAVIDLDTLMPGYFIYDLGDLVRTIVSPVSEEEQDVRQIVVRKEFFDAVVEGYLSEMGDALTAGEREQVPFAGLMMTYIMAVRFLTDFLCGDVYYHTRYPGQNLVRAQNQFCLLESLAREYEGSER